MTLRWPRPDGAEVELVVSRIADPTVRSLFFSRLHNPEWLPPLYALKVFDTVPDGVDDTAGARRWPEGEYLARVAAEHPETATKVFRRHQDSVNPWVQRAILDGIATLPVVDAAALTSVVVKLVTEATGWIDVDKVLTLAERLSAASQIAKSNRLLTALFAPRAGGEEKTVIGTRARVVTSMEDYHYQELLTRAVSLLVARPGITGLRLLIDWLRRAARIRAGDSDPDHALSRSSVADHVQNSGSEDITDSLIVAIRDTALQLGATDDTRQFLDVLDVLDGDRLFILRRAGVEVTAQLLARAQDSADGSAAAPVGLRRAGYALLTDVRLMELDARPEYVHLALTLVPRLDPEQRQEWEALVRSPLWQGSDDVIRRMLTWGRTEPDAITADDITAARERMLHRFLQPLEAVLPDGLAADLTALHAAHGPVEHPEFGMWSESHFGPTSPLPAAALAALGGPGLLDLLQTWSPSDARSFGETVTGLAREVQQVVTAHPVLLEDLADRIARLGRSYVRAALEGWATAAADGYRPSPAVWHLVETVLGQHDDGAEVASDFDGHDAVWRYAQRAAVAVVSAFVGKQPHPLAPGETDRLFALLRPAIDHVDPTPAHESRQREQGMDPLTISLNTTRPAALRAAIRLTTASPGSSGDDDVRRAIIDAVDAHVGFSRDPSLAVAAVFGEGIGRLATTSPGWVERHRPALFAVLDGDEDVRGWADVVVSVALRIYQANIGFLELVRPAISDMLTPAYLTVEHSEGWRGHEPAVQAAALVLVHVHLLGDIDQDDPQLQQLFSPAVPDSVVAAAIGRIGWQLMRARREAQHGDSAVGESAGGSSTPPPEYLERARLLIDRRVAEIDAGRADPAELAQFHWWVQSHVFAPSWWLPILLRAASHPDFGIRGRFGAVLADAARHEPVLAMQALVQLYERREETWGDYDLLQNAHVVIAAAQRAANAEAAAIARRFTDLLARQGHFDVLDRLEALGDAGGQDGEPTNP